MRSKLINKAKIKNIFIRKSTWILVGIFLISIITIPTFLSKAGDGSRIVEYEDSLRILDVEPGNKFLIQKQNGKVDGVNVEVTQMSMPEFISNSTKLTGYYDAIVVGRNNDGLDKQFSIAKKTKYYDYSAPFSNKLDKAKYTSAQDDSQMKTMPYSYPDEPDKGRKFVEYYSENDITNKRAKDVIEMINNKQLVYFDEKIFNSRELSTSKLVSNFQKYTEKIFPQNSINISKIVSDYKAKSEETKRPYIEKLEASNDDSKVENEIDGQIYGDRASRNMEFKITIPSVSEGMVAKLYFDINADGVYTDNELKQTFDLSECSVGNDVYKLTQTLDSYFIGYLDWKIEVVRDNNVSSYITYHSIFKAIDKAHRKALKVLQIHPYVENDSRNGENLYLCPGSNPTTPQRNFKEKALDQKEVVNSGYDLTIDAIRYDKFNDINDKDSYLKKYDMIIIGFSDNYMDCQINTDSCDAIEKFIKQGKSCMFTHDTMTLNTFGNVGGKYNGWYMGVGPKVFGQRFRDYVGQARYVDPYRNSGVRDSNGNSVIEEDYTSTDKKKVIIPHDKYPSILSGDVYSMGITLYMNDYKSTQSTKVRNINEAQITSYPFDLTKNKNQIQVANTHTQWFQLNLEDENVVPWFNLSNDNLNSGDSRNNYYTYSKGNITYSGTGHSNDYPEQELKLFVNTIIKAARGGNEAPTLMNYKVDTSNEDVSEFIAGDLIEDKSFVQNDNNENLEISKDEDFYFVTKVSDLDNDDIKVTMNVDGTKINPIDTPKGKSINSEKFPSGTKNVYKSDSFVGGKIDKAFMKNKGGSYITVTVIATDWHNASTSRSFKIKVKKNNAPDVTNYKDLDLTEIIEDKGVVVVDKSSDFIFNSKIEDQDNDICSAVVIAEDAEILSKEDIHSGDVLKNITVPKSMLQNKAPGERLLVTVKATDVKGDSTTKSFYLEINKPDIFINHGFYSERRNGIPFINSQVKEVKNMEENIKVAGFANSIFEYNEVLKLSIADGLKVKGKVKVIVESNNNVETEMTSVGDNNYECTLSGDVLGSIPKDGAKVRVEYVVDLVKMINPKSDVASCDYVNFLSINNTSVGAKVVDKKFVQGNPYLY